MPNYRIGSPQPTLKYDYYHFRDQYEERADKCAISKVFQDIQNRKQKREEQSMKNRSKQSSPDSQQGDEDSSKASSSSGSHDEGEEASIPTTSATATQVDEEAVANISKSANADSIAGGGSCEVADGYFWTNYLDPEGAGDGEDAAVVVAAAEETEMPTECTTAATTTTAPVSTATSQERFMLIYFSV